MKNIFTIFGLVVLLNYSCNSQSVIILNQSNPCGGVCNGKVTFSVSGGTPPYTVIMSNGSSCTNPTVAAFPSTVTINNFCSCASNYNCLFFDNSANLMGSQNITIISPAPINAIVTKTNICCNGLCNGDAAALVTGGTPPYTYTWMPSSITSSVISNVCAALYTLTVTDSKTCVSTFSANVTQPAPLVLTYTITAASCFTCCDGQIKLGSTGGGTSAKLFQLNSSGYSVTTTYSNLCVGGYTVSVKDSCCLTVSTVTLSTPSVNNEILKNTGGIKIYPNPANDKIKIVSTKEEKAVLNFELYDILGNKILSGPITNDEIYVGNIAEGVFELRVYSSAKNEFRQKLIIKRE